MGKTIGLESGWGVPKSTTLDPTFAEYHEYHDLFAHIKLSQVFVSKMAINYIYDFSAEDCNHAFAFIIAFPKENW